MSITSALYKAARLSADARAVKRSIQTGSPKPIVRRLVNITIGRNIVSRLFLK
jgi:hypothetical protein